MFPIYGKPIIQHVINRVKKSKFVKKLVVATSNNIKDDQLADYLSKLKVNIYRGELKNVSRRMLDVANLYKAKYFIRISGDSPLIDHKLIDKLGGIYNKHRGKYEIITNVFPRSFPKGQSVELIKTQILKENIHLFGNLELEHVTKYFYKNYKHFKIKNFRNLSKNNLLKLSIDTKQDLKNLLYYFNKNDKFKKFKIIK